MSEQETMVAALAETVASALPPAAPEAPAAEVETPETESEAPASAEGQADPERKRRRRRSRRGRRSQEEGVTLDADGQPIEAGDDAEEGDTAHGALIPAPAYGVTATSEPVKVEAPEAGQATADAVANEPVAPAVAAAEPQAPVAEPQAPVAVAAEPVTAAPAVAEPVAAEPAAEPVAAEPVQTEPAQTAAVVAEPAAAVEPAVAAEPAVTEPAAPPAPAAEPVRAEPVRAEPVQTAPVPPAAVVRPAAAPIVVGDAALNAVVQAAGLTWVQTDPVRHAQSQARSAADQAPVRLGRERKPVAPVSSAPLVQVETRH